MNASCRNEPQTKENTTSVSIANPKKMDEQYEEQVLPKLMSTGTSISSFELESSVGKAVLLEKLKSFHGCILIIIS